MADLAPPPFAIQQGFRVMGNAMFTIRATSFAVASFALASTLSGCATTSAIVSVATPTPSVPSRPLDACSMVRENPLWGKALGKTARKWGVRAGLVLAFVYQESGFKADARPPRKDGFLFVPGERASDAYGYPQAKDATWAQYKKEGGPALARRDNFADAADFVGWYVTQTEKRTGVPRNDAVRQYLAYHEGAGGYMRATYRSKQWLMTTADTVGRNANAYERQITHCTSALAEERNFMSGILPF